VPPVPPLPPAPPVPPLPPVPPVPPPPVPPPPGGGNGNGGGAGQGGQGGNDELEDYGDAILASLANIASLITTGVQDDPNGCLCQIAPAIQGVTSTLASLLGLLPTGLSAPVVNIDLAPVVDAVNNLIAAVQNITAPGAPGGPGDQTAIDADLKAIVDGIRSTDAAGAVPVNPTPPQPTPFVQPAPYTVAQAIADVEAAITQMPNVILAPQT